MTIRTDKGLIGIGKIVNQNMDILVASYNEDKKCIEYKPIINSYKIKSNLTTNHYKIGLAYRGKCAGRQKYIECTEDHKLYVNHKWIYAKDIKVGDNLSHFADYVPTEAFQMILGSLLGDASIAHKQGHTTVHFGHCIDQIDYLNYKKKLLGKYATSEKNRVSGYGSEIRSFGVRSSLYINKYVSQNCINKNGKKVVTKQWCDDLTPISLAFWYMDDGTLKNREDDNLGERISLATNSFSIQECKLLQDALKNKFGINSEIHSKLSYKGNVITIGVEDTEKFTCLIAPYVCRSMKYKLPKKYENMRCVYEDYNPVYKEGILDAKVLSIESERPQKFGRYMYNIEVADNKNYFAQGALVK